MAGDPAADPRAGLEDDDRSSGPLDRERGREAGEARPDDDHVGLDPPAVATPAPATAPRRRGGAARQREPGPGGRSGTDHGAAGDAALAHGPARGIGTAGLRAGGFQTR